LRTLQHREPMRVSQGGVLRFILVCCLGESLKTFLYWNEDLSIDKAMLRRLGSNPWSVS